MDTTDRELRRARLRDPATYATVGEWYAGYRGFVPIQMAHALSTLIQRDAITFAEAHRRLRDADAIIEISDRPFLPEPNARPGASTANQRE